MPAVPKNPGVLVVDDEEDSRWLTAEVLRDEGFFVIEAPNGRVALDYLLETPTLPVLIVADLNMPVMNGRDMITVVRSYLRFANIPIVVVTAEENLAATIDQFRVPRLLKPYLPGDLLGIVRTQVGAAISSR